MNEILTAIQKHLGRQLTVSQLDYYQVFGLEPFCSDHAQIEAALQAARQKLTKSEPSSSLQVVSKLIKQAESILLDPSKKTAYDSQLAKLFESQKKRKDSGQTSNARANPSVGIFAKTASQKNTKSAVGVVQPNEDQLLPKGDPMQPFVLPQADLPSPYETTSALTNLSVQKRREELSELFPSLMMMSHDPQALQEQTPAWLIAADRKSNKPTTTASNSAVPSHSSNEPTARPLEAPVDLVGQLRKRRQRRNLLAVGSMVLAAVGLLGFASYRFATNRMKVAQAEQDKKLLRRNGANEQQLGSGVDQANNKLPELIIGPNPGRKGSANNQQPLPQLPQVTRDPADSLPPETPVGVDSSQTQPNPSNPDQLEPGKPAVPEKTDPSMANPAMPEGASPEGAMPEPPATSESPDWKRSMTQARQWLANGDLKQFDPLMTSLLDKAVTKEGKEQTLRLDQAGQLYKIYVESFEEAKRKAKGASSLKVGSAEIRIDEISPEKLVVRSQGQNKSYQWDKLPLGLAAALSDLGLSESAPVDVAARAIYFSLTPFYQEEAKANSLITKRIDGWFERSAGKESVRADIKKFLTDIYE